MKLQQQLNEELLNAAENGNLENVKTLLADGADVNSKNNHGINALDLAAQNGHEEIVEILILKGINVNALTQDGLTALHFAARKGFFKIAALLIQSGIDVSITGLRYHRAALHYAAEMGHDKIVKALLDAKARTDVKDIMGETPFDLANKKGHIETALILRSKHHPE
jgi:ankyrin repeat protein